MTTALRHAQAYKRQSELNRSNAFNIFKQHAMPYQEGSHEDAFTAIYANPLYWSHTRYYPFQHAGKAIYAIVRLVYGCMSYLHAMFNDATATEEHQEDQEDQIKAQTVLLQGMHVQLVALLMNLVNLLMTLVGVCLLSLPCYLYQTYEALFTKAQSSPVSSDSSVVDRLFNDINSKTYNT